MHGHRHRVEAHGSVVRQIRWQVDGQPAATKRTIKGNVSLEADTGTGDAIELQFNALGQAERVTLFERGAASRVEQARDAMGDGGVDLDPDPGSPAARREQRIREHPWRHAAMATAVGVAKVVIPLLVGLVSVRFAMTVPWPDWTIPWPDIALPHISWPHLPAIPWPGVDLPSWQLPVWIKWVMKATAYGWPVLLALLLAKLEVDRRREQDALKAALAEPATVPDQDASHGAKG